MEQDPDHAPGLLSAGNLNEGLGYLLGYLRLHIIGKEPFYYIDVCYRRLSPPLFPSRASNIFSGVKERLFIFTPTAL